MRPSGPGDDILLRVRARAASGPFERAPLPRLLAALSVLLAGGFFLVGQVPGMVAASRERVRRAMDFLHLDPAAARERAFGADYARAIEQIRRVVPEGATYVLAADGAVITDFVAYDLAPRKALLVDGGRPTVRTLRGREDATDLPRFTVVVPGAGAPPRLEPTATLTGAP